MVIFSMIMLFLLVIIAMLGAVIFQFFRYIAIGILVFLVYKIICRIIDKK